MYPGAKEYWAKLRQIIQLYRESVTMKTAPNDAWGKAMDESKKEG